jgi:hypothetical protein
MPLFAFLAHSTIISHSVTFSNREKEETRVNTAEGTEVEETP